MSLKPWEVQAQSTVMASENDARRSQFDGVSETIIHVWNPQSLMITGGIAGFTGVIIGFLAFFIALALGLERSWWYLFIGGAAGTLIVWIAVLAIFIFAMVIPQLQFMRRDLNHNGVPDMYEKPESTVIQMTYVDEEGNYKDKIENFEIPASKEKLRELAVGTLNMHRPFATREWTGPEKLFSDTEFRKLQDLFESKHYKFIILKNPNSPKQGYLWTHKGLAVLQQFLPETYAGQEL